MNKIKTRFISAAIILFVTASVFGKSVSQDSLIISGKGMYLWQLWTSEGGGKNLDKIITKLKSLDVTWVVIKMGDGDSNYNSPNHSLYNWAVQNYKSMDSVTSVFHKNGIKLLAFQYVYGAPHHWGNPASETDVANLILSVKGLDGLLIDAEIEYDVLANNVAAAQAYCDSIHAYHPESFIGLTAWARINGHNSFPWTTFLDRVEVNMPQTYWAARPTTPTNELNISSTQFTAYTKTWVSLGDSAADKPIMPLGQGEYFGYGSDVQFGDITTFCNLSQSTYNYPGVSLWEYNQITQSYVWDEYAASWKLTSVSDKSNSPNSFYLSQNYPNPFNPTTKIKYTIPASLNPSKGGTFVGTSLMKFVQLKVYDILGREIATLVNGEKQPGNYEVEFNAEDTHSNASIPSGVYFYQLSISNANSNQAFMQTKKMILMK